jgi:ubiquinone/menaquinone biosynthesis C-methylase UbiE
MTVTSGSTRQPLGAITAQYDRVARFYAVLELLFLIFPIARRKAVAALALEPGDTVLEIGAGTGRNLPYLCDAVGPQGTVIAVDASEGMLAEARRIVDREGWQNVQLLHQDAARLMVDRELDGALFSLSYSVLPDPRPALARAWQLLRPSARVGGHGHGAHLQALAPSAGPDRPPARQARSRRSLLRALG